MPTLPEAFLTKVWIEKQGIVPSSFRAERPEGRFLLYAAFISSSSSTNLTFILQLIDIARPSIEFKVNAGAPALYYWL